MQLTKLLITAIGLLQAMQSGLCNICICKIFLARNGAFSALMLLVGWQEGHSACKKTQWWGAGVVICLEQGADLHTAQLMPMPLAVSCFSKMQIGLPFWYRLTQVVLDKGLLNGCVRVFSKKRGRHDFIF